jgi:hypothetical protein
LWQVSTRPFSTLINPSQTDLRVDLGGGTRSDEDREWKKEDGKVPKTNLQAPEKFSNLKGKKECERLLEKWVRFGFVFCAKLALKILFLIDKQKVKDFSIWVRFAKWGCSGEDLMVCYESTGRTGTTGMLRPLIWLLWR